MLEFIRNWLVINGMHTDTAIIVTKSVACSMVIILSILADFVAKRYLLSGLTRLISHTKTTWDDIFLNRKVFNKLSHLAPAVVIYLLVDFALPGADSLITFVKNTVTVYMIIIGLLFIDSFLNAVLDIYRSFEISRELPIRSFMQLAKIVIYFIGAIFIISIILNKTPIYFLSGLGAMTAVLMLIFKDAILGFVAGIQLTANKMVAHGDWIEMPKYGADGDVLEVTLTTVKVQNWDKTITTIPTYALISESFKNWRGMQESGGRRIKRAIYIDLNSIKFCTTKMLEKFSKIKNISEYLEKKMKEINAYNASLDQASLINGRQLTNIGTFRAYLNAYLGEHPLINQDLTFLIRQLDPTAHGLPIEIYVFSKDIRWANYEAIQADIFDHILAVVDEFGLKLFQNPTGSDFKTLVKDGPELSPKNC